MSFYSDQILPRAIGFVMSWKMYRDQRKEALSSASGAVLEVGFGPGLNLPFYPRTVTKLIATDPSKVSLNLAKKKSPQLPFPIEFLLAPGEELPVPTSSVDQVVTTWTLCTIPDVAGALREIRRVLKPSGKYLFLEHGLADDRDVAKWQHRLNPLQRFLVGNCHLDRPIQQLIESAGFKMEHLSRFYMEGPKVASSMYRGTAVNPQ